MTVQTLFPVYLEGNKYLITNCTSWLYFNPKDYGIKAQAFSTANHDGYYCSYEIADGKLRLKDFETYNNDANYPPLNGVEPDLPKHKYDYCCWKDVAIDMDYTGALALVDPKSKRVEDFFMPRKPFFFWEKVTVAAFEHGVLTASFDLSDISEEMWGEYQAAESKEQRRTMRRVGTWHFGMMTGVHDSRRSIVDTFYASRFRDEQKALLEAFSGRLGLGEPRGRFPWTYCPISYAPLGCESLVIGHKDFVSIADRFEARKMVREDAEMISGALCRDGLKDLGHLTFPADEKILHEISFLIHPEYDEAYLDRKASCNVYHHLNSEEIAKLRKLIDEAFGIESKVASR